MVKPPRPSMQRPPWNRGCAEIFLYTIILGAIFLVGWVWLISMFPSQGVRQLTFTVDLFRVSVYGLLLAIPGILASLFLRSLRYRLLRGFGLSMAVAALHAVAVGIALAFDRRMEYPGLPAWLLPLISITFSLLVLIVARQGLLAFPRSALLVLTVLVGGLASSGYLLYGVPGTLTELLQGVLEALGTSLITALLVGLFFLFDNEFPRRAPLVAALLAAGMVLAFSPALSALRGYWVQGQNLSYVLGAGGLVVGALFILEPVGEPKRRWWAAFIFLFVLLAPALILTDGIEGDYMFEDVSNAWQAASQITIPLSLLLGLVLIAFRQRIGAFALRLEPLQRLGLFILAVLLPITIYRLGGGTGLQVETTLAVLRSQADTHSVQELPDPSNRFQAVYDILTEHAFQEQVGLRTLLEENNAPYTSFYLVNAVEFSGNSDLRRQVARLPEVDYMLASPQVRPSRIVRPAPVAGDAEHTSGETSWSVEMLQAGRVWDELGVTGEGIVIGFADSGATWRHPALITGYLGGQNNHNYTWFDPQENTKTPTDHNGHGTATLGAALGRDGIGVAPGAKWIACRNLSYNLGNPGDYLRCMQFLFAPFPQGGDPFLDGEPERGAHLTNNSWGCPPVEGCDRRVLDIAIGHLRNAGQMFISAAGNEGPDCGSISPPANSDEALSVGAVDESKTIIGFSSRGPTQDGDGSSVIKPDVVAPGVDVLSTWPGDGYRLISGTSFSAPYVTGVVALMWSANPDLIGNVEATEALLAKSASPVEGEPVCGSAIDMQNNLSGFGLVDAFQAVQLALNWQP